MERDSNAQNPDGEFREQQERDLLGQSVGFLNRSRVQLEEGLKCQVGV